MEFNFDVTHDGQTTTYYLLDDFDYMRADHFVEEMKKCTALSVIIDFQLVRFVDSTGAGALVRILRSLKGRFADVRVVNVSPEVYAVFELMGLVQVYGTRTISMKETAGTEAKE